MSSLHSCHLPCVNPVLKDFAVLMHSATEVLVNVRNSVVFSWHYMLQVVHFVNAKVKDDA